MRIDDPEHGQPDSAKTIFVVEIGSIAENGDLIGNEYFRNAHKWTVPAALASDLQPGDILHVTKDAPTFYGAVNGPVNVRSHRAASVIKVIRP